MMSQPSTLGALNDSGWRDRSVKDELRENFVARVRGGGELFPGIVGYEETVIP
ncbi:MAG: magnesium chelatase, partial [Actinobacteria bacterium]